MQNFNISNLTFKQIQLFLAAARYENFSLAASSLNVTQPLVSRTVSQLEADLGFPLFVRERRRVSLTAAGKELYDQWKRLYAFAERCMDSVFKADEWSRTALTVFDDSNRTAYLAPIVEAFTAAHPEVVLRVDQMDPTEIVAGVLSGYADIGFLMEPELIRLKGTDTCHKTIFTSPHCVDVSAHHPFYTRESLTLQDFDGMPVTLMSNSINAIYSNSIRDMFKQAGIQPQYTYVSSNSALDFARTSRHGGLVVMHNMLEPFAGTRRIPIEGTETSLFVFWRRDNHFPPLKAFIDSAMEAMKSFDPVIPV